MIRVGVNLLFSMPGHPSGIDVYARRVACGLAETGAIQPVLLCNRDIYDEFADDSKLERALVEFPTGRRKAVLVAERRQLPRLARQHKLDLLWSPAGTCPAQAPCPQVATIHDLRHERFGERYSTLVLWSRHRAVRRALRACDKVIAPSRFTAEDLEQLYDADPLRLAVIPHGVDPDFGALNQAQLERVRAKLKLPEQFAMLPGATDWHKNQITAVRAVRRLRDDWGIDLPLVLVGPAGNAHEEVLAEAEAQQVGALIHHLGVVERSELPALYCLAACLLFPSRLEGFGLQVLEAFSCSCPVICSNSGALPETAGDAALLVDPDHVEGMSHALRLVLREPELRKSLIERGLQRAAELTWQRTIERTAALLGEIAAGRRD